LGRGVKYITRLWFWMLKRTIADRKIRALAADGTFSKAAASAHM
jgi:hypothetical protein